MGMERLLMLIDNSCVEIPKPDTADLYIASMGSSAQLKAFTLAEDVRKSGCAVQCDIVGRGLRPQMKYADKIGAKFSVVIGDNEIAENKAELKNMSTGEKKVIPLDDFTEKFIDALIDEENKDILEF
jgi:histidyl-tRNA synthetase